MEDLKKQEQFEIEVLSFMNSNKLLNPLIFCGGTMLRLCYGLNRFSVDLDFWMLKEIDYKSYFNDLKGKLEKEYIIKYSADKYYTILFEIRSSRYPRALKIEIRKNKRKINTEYSIAFSEFSNKQVMVRTVSLEDMLVEKINAFLNRREIRDAFDLEFLLKKGVKCEVDKENIKRILDEIDSLSKYDYNVKLAGLLRKEEREFYRQKNFYFLKEYFNEKLHNIER